MGPRLGWAVEWTPRAQERVPGLSEAQREDEPCESGCVSCRVYLSSPACRELAHWPCGLPRGGGGAGLRLSCAALKPCGLRQVLPPCLGFDVLISKPETPGPAAGGREESARRPGARRAGRCGRGPAISTVLVAFASVEDSGPQLPDALSGFSYDPRPGAVVHQLLRPLLVPCHFPLSFPTTV